MPSNLFFIFIFTLILLIIIFACDRFFFPVSSLDIWFVGDWVSWFFHWSCFKSNDTGHEFWRVDTVRDFIFFFTFFFYVFIILHFLKKIGFVVILVATQFLTHVFDKFSEKFKNSEKHWKPKKYIFNIFASFLAFSASSKKNLKFQRSFERVQLLTRYF